MLALRPNCECCDRDLPPMSGEAMICSFETSICGSAFCARMVPTIWAEVPPGTKFTFTPGLAAMKGSITALV